MHPLHQPWQFLQGARDLRRAAPLGYALLLDSLEGAPALPFAPDDGRTRSERWIACLAKVLPEEIEGARWIPGPAEKYLQFLAECQGGAVDLEDWNWGPYLHTDLWRGLIDKVLQPIGQVPFMPAVGEFAVKVRGAGADRIWTTVSGSALPWPHLDGRRLVLEGSSGEWALVVWASTLIDRLLEAICRGVPMGLLEPLRALVELQRLGMYPGGTVDGCLLIFEHLGSLERRS